MTIRLQSKKNVIASSESDAVLLLKITKNSNLPLVLRSQFALLTDFAGEIGTVGFGIVLSRNLGDSNLTGVAVLANDLHYLEEDDVIRVVPHTNVIRAIYRKKANANFLFVTERCNSFCLMCSQPPRNVDDDHLVDELITVVPLIPRNTKNLGITGGEPLLLGEKFFKLVQTLNAYLPDTSLHVLTNGRLFSEFGNVNELVKINHNDLMFGIPLYSDLPHIHDYVVQADGAFDQTIRGILNLKRCRQKVEIRVVLHKITYKRLPQLAEFIARNLQFVDHVALMGLEITGFTRANLEELWIDPIEYADELSEAIRIFVRAKIHVSIYNLQRCLLPKELWDYAVKSISDWKNIYFDECEECTEKNSCGGFFESSKIKKSDNIRSIAN